MLDLRHESEVSSLSLGRLIITSENLSVAGNLPDLSPFCHAVPKYKFWTLKQRYTMLAGQLPCMIGQMIWRTSHGQALQKGEMGKAL